ncbi:digestive organ expansion factor [Phanerochaete sordida]|uniref:U3 small nucleolar RNA-associated protein 25 n=1 Tax=Phanerochaete sordida TaxID=48140 RepID=A0A9P3FXY7_9APHY|nr:digestive organ expansion factor [Phanerochaete sordida]
MAIDRGNETTTQLLTLLNVSATKAGKRKWILDDTRPSEKLNKRRNVQFGEVQVNELEDTPEETAQDTAEGDETMEDAEEIPEPAVDDEDVNDAADPYEAHFGPSSSDLSEARRVAVENKSWKTQRAQYGKLGSAVDYVPEAEGSNVEKREKPAILERLWTPFQERQTKVSKDVASLQNDVLTTLSSNKDLYVTRTPLDSQQSIREAISLHALNHITKKRRRVLKNNERITHAKKSETPAPEDVQDQGFTRPSVLILLPFRSFAQRWVSALTSHTPPPSFQVENRSRFETEYGLPPGAVDKLLAAEPGTYPKDHVEMFRGNVDDSFRLGVKMTRKSMKLFADFYGCDVIIASPLGLRMSIEKEKNADFLSSIELLIMDQMDALTMQNWEHVQFVFSQLNKLPKESHDVDFSRIKPWYLDGHAAFLRQSVLLSAYETPETRALFNNTLLNVAGKLRTESRWRPVPVPEGVDQNFIQFDCSSPKDEPDKRFQHFTTQVLPAVLKSAVQSANTVVFVPSSFDFIRVQNHFRKTVGVSFAVLSEYSSNQEISRARQAFFSGKKSFLLVSERFHFFRRYKIRGIRNLIFYGPPDHPQFYTEFLSYPFLDDGVEPSDVTCKILYSRYDHMRLERIAGTEGVGELVKRSTF